MTPIARQSHLLVLSLLLTVTLGACARDAAETAAGGHGGEGIAWFEGSVDEAFALARQQGRAVFLYWGAEWCPPCHYLKDKIFTSPSFVASTRQMVAVYLDGDTERAQILGEQLAVEGYPTVILFSSDGREMLRMSSDTPVERYAEVLERGMRMTRPVGEILAAVLADGPASATPENLEVLAFHSWGQDRQTEAADGARLAAFRTLYAGTPDHLASQRSRFLTLYLGELATAAGDAEPGAAPLLDDDERASLRQAVTALLADPARRDADLQFVFFNARDTVELLAPSPSPERDALVASWLDAAKAVEASGDLPVDDRLSALLPQVWLARWQAEGSAPAGEEASDPPLPPALLARVRERVQWAGETVKDPGELQAVMSTMAFLLEESGLASEAETLLTARLGDTSAPYYYMSWVAGMKAKGDHPQEALTWYRLAYDNSRGRYSRFRWGSTYLRQALKLAPDEEATIDVDSREILGELLTFDDAFAGGNYSRLQQLDEAYLEWNGDGRHGALLAGLRDLVQGACPRYPDQGEDSQRRRCESFLAGLPATAG